MYGGFVSLLLVVYKVEQMVSIDQLLVQFCCELTIQQCLMRLRSAACFVTCFILFFIFSIFWWVRISLGIIHGNVASRPGLDE